MTKDAKHRFLSKLEQMAEELYRRGDSVSHDAAGEETSAMWQNIVKWAGETYDAVGGTLHELSLRWRQWRAS